MYLAVINFVMSHKGDIVDVIAPYRGEMQVTTRVETASPRLYGF
jgi:hypothetical protein